MDSLESDALLSDLDHELWGGIFGADEVINGDDPKTASKRLEVYLKARLSEPRLRPLLKVTKTGHGPMDAKKLKLFITRWVGRLPSLLARAVEEGRAVAGRLVLAGGKAQATLYVPTARDRESRDADQAARSMERRLGHVRDEVRRDGAALNQQARDLGLLVERLVAVTAELGAGSPGTAPPQPPAAPRNAAADRLAFKSAYDRLNTARRGYVPIYKVRGALGWDRDRFDQTVADLRRDLAVELQVGDPSYFDAAAATDSYEDDDETLYLTMSWRA